MLDFVAFGDHPEDVAVIADHLFSFIEPERHDEMLISPCSRLGLGAEGAFEDLVVGRTGGILVGEKPALAPAASGPGDGHFGASSIDAFSYALSEHEVNDLFRKYPGSPLNLRSNGGFDDRFAVRDEGRGREPMVV